MRNSKAPNYHFMVDAASDALIALGADGRVLVWNPAAERITGYSAREAEGALLGDLLPPAGNDENGPAALLDNPHGDTPPATVKELTIKRKDGQAVPVEVSVSRRKTRSTQATLLTIRDITERKQAEEALRQAQAELEARVRERTRELAEANGALQIKDADRERAEAAVKAERQLFIDVLDTLPAYLVLLSPDHHVPFANKFFRERFGESHGKRCFEYLFGRTEPCEICQTYNVLKTMTPLEWEWTGPDGRNYYIFDFPFTDTDGSTLIMEVGIDITERKQAEEALRQAQAELEARVRERTRALKESEEALRESEEELSAILANMPILTLVVDEARRVLKVNDAAVKFCGRSIEEMLALRAGEALGCLHAGDDPRGCGFGPACQTCLTRLCMVDSLETGKSHYQVEWQRPFRRGDRIEEVSFLLSTVLLATREKKLLVCIQDITERTQAEAEIKQLNEDLRRHAAELEAANKELEAFTYSVSHDLRTPLRSMEGFSQALAEDYADKLDEQGRKYLGYVQESSELMGQLIDDLLKLSRVTRQEMSPDSVNLDELARPVIAELKKHEPGRQVDVTIAPGLICRGDARLLRIALENLLGNAWKFTGKAAPARIEVGGIEKDGRKTYFVRDNGAGFDMKYADKLFQPFQRLHKASDFPGTGVGLATVQRIIRRHGGEVWGEGKTGEGATFYFTLGQ
ncbi:MAG: PAS domain S-box protein [Chloroflexi bacterium]|nr:PAS domain S-box protein [Chloroflexota bacterium]